jgi:hypothetical protein
MDALVEKPGRFESPSFQFIEIALDAFWITHAQKLPRGLKRVTILCDSQ